MKNLLSLLPFLYLLLAIAAGWFIATQINSQLAISFEDKELPRAPELRPATIIQPQQTTWPTVINVAADEDAHDAISAAIDELTAALKTHGIEPAFGQSDGAITIQTNSSLTETWDHDAFGLTESNGSITIEGSSQLATAYGVYNLADRILAGEDVTGINEIIAPDLRYRYVDLSGIGVKAGEELWDGTDYSHHSRAFEHVILAEAPYINEEAFAQVESDYQAYIQQMISYGYNGIIINGYMEYINFDGVGDGFEVYPADSDYRGRHLVLRERLGDMYSYAADQGMSVIFKTDMLALTEPLEAYLNSELGGLDANDPRLWSIYRAGLAEFYEQMPFVDGMMIRIGEAGAIYNLEGWNYYSGLHVTTDVAVQRMLNEFGAVSAENGKNIYFRTWSIGVGNVGDIHTNPDTYLRVLDDQSLNELNNLVVSTKHTKGDFDAWLPQNPTLKVGDQPRIIEMQARREFENFTVFPNYMTPEHQVDLQDFLAENPNIDGVWMWTDGGPWRSGPYLLYPDHGYTDMIDVNMVTGAQLAWNVNADTTTLAEQWVRRTISIEPETVQTVTNMLLDSREVVRQSYYIEPFAQKDVRAFGLEVPPMFWLFKWDIVSGSPSALGAVYNVVSEDVESAIAKGAAAMDQLEQMQTAVSTLDDANTEMLKQSLDYEHSVFGTLQAYRKTFLHYFKWLDTGTGEWSADLNAFDTAKDDHLATYSDSAQFPALNFFAAEQLQTIMRRTPLTAWLARALLILLVGLIIAAPTIREAIFTPFTSGNISNDVDNRLVWIVAIIALLLGRMIFTSFASWAYLLWFGLALLVYLIIGRLWSNGDTYHTTTILTAMLAPLLLRMAILMGIVAFRGSFFFWFRLWLNEPFRTLYIIINVVTLLWLLGVLFMLMRNFGGMSIWGALGLVLAAVGGFLLITGILPMPLGLDRTLTIINDQMLVIPAGLSRILGITTHLGIPLTLPRILTIAGAITLGVGLILRLLSNR